MSRVRANSSPDLLPSSTMAEQYDDSALEGVAANIKLLLKLIEDHKDACSKDKKDSRRMLRVAGMMTILDMVRTRIQKCQSFGNKTSEAKLTRCNTDLKTNAPRDKRPSDHPTVDERERLRKELNASLAARKSLQIMCSSLGKEKEIMAGELARKVHELSGLEEHVNDLRAQNETLLEKVQEYAAAAEHEKRCSVGERQSEGNAALHERNRALSEQLLRSLDGYRSMKRRLREAQEQKLVMHETMEEMGVKIGDSLERIRAFKQNITSGNEELAEIEEEVSGLENLLEGFDSKISKKGQRKGECEQPKGEISACTHSVLA